MGGPTIVWVIIGVVFLLYAFNAWIPATWLSPKAKEITSAVVVVILIVYVIIASGAGAAAWARISGR